MVCWLLSINPLPCRVNSVCFLTIIIAFVFSFFLSTYEVHLVYLAEGSINAADFLNSQLCYPFCHKLQSTPWFANLLSTGVFVDVGLFYVYLDNALLFIAPVGLNSLTGGSGYVGFTASTSAIAWAGTVISQWSICATNESGCRYLI